MKFIRSAAIALCLGLTLAMAIGSAASAFTIIKVTGNHGDWGTSPATSDSPGSPGAKCGYSASDAMGVAHLAWIKVFPFKAQAYNRTGALDSQPVTFMVTVQSSADGGSTWKNLGSTSQTRTASENASAKYGTLKVAATGQAGKVYRAVVTLKWLNNGHTDGLAKVSMDYYSVKWTVGAPGYVYNGACDGTAD